MKILLKIEPDGLSGELSIGNTVVSVSSKEDVLKALRAFEVGDFDGQIPQDEHDRFMKELKISDFPKS